MHKNNSLKKSITRSSQILYILKEKTLVRSLMVVLTRKERKRISLSYIIICTGTMMVEKEKREKWQ